MVYVLTIYVGDDCVLFSQFRGVGDRDENANVFVDGAACGPIIDAFYLANCNGVVSQFDFRVFTIIPVCDRVFGGLRDVRVTLVAFKGVDYRLGQAMRHWMGDRLFYRDDVCGTVFSYRRERLDVGGAQDMVRQAAGLADREGRYDVRQFTATGDFMFDAANELITSGVKVDAA